VHLADEEYDTGQILAQKRVPVLDGDTPELLAERVLAAEHELFPLVVIEAAEAIRGGKPLAGIRLGGEDGQWSTNRTGAV